MAAAFAARRHRRPRASSARGHHGTRPGGLRVRVSRRRRAPGRETL